MESTDKIEVVNRYIAAFDTADIAIIREIYAQNATLEDPVGSPARVGIDAICEFYKDALEAGIKLTLTGDCRCAGNAVAFPFTVEMPGMTIEVIDVFEFNTDGKITSMKAYWGPENT